MSSYLFLTGTARSGTTLAEKLAHNLSATSIMSQPFPGLFIAAKQLFYQLFPAFERPLPLHHGFPPIPGELEAFTEFLCNRPLSRKETDLLLGNATASPGQNTAAVIGLAVDNRHGSFTDLWKQLHDTAIGDNPSIVLRGSKEVYCEDFLPAFDHAGIRCIVTIRDPRAVIASLLHGRYAETSRHRYPLLLHLRNWRKAAYRFLESRNSHGIGAFRLEDYAGDPSILTGWIAGRFELEPRQEGHVLLDQDGRPWKGNSSYSGLPTDNRSPMWKSRLSGKVVQAIECLCGPEMSKIGYTSESLVDDPSSCLERLTDPPGTRFVEGDMLDKSSRQLEQRRLDAIYSGTYDRDLFQNRTIFEAVACC